MLVRKNHRYIVLLKLTPWLLVCKRTIPAKQPPLVGEVSTHKSIAQELILKIESDEVISCDFESELGGGGTVAVDDNSNMSGS
jgi:hypothetical protein